MRLSDYRKGFPRQRGTSVMPEDEDKHIRLADERSFKMKRRLCISLLVASVLCVCSVALAQQEKQPLINSDVARMIKAGSPEAAIVQVIEQSTSCFDISPQSVVELKSQGASEAILAAMKRVSPGTMTAGPGDNAHTSLVGLPCKQGYFYKSGTEWIELNHSSISKAKLKGTEKMFLSGGIIGGGMDLVYEGPQATLKVTGPRPTFYVHLPGQSSFIDQYFFRSRTKQVIVQMDQKKSTRLLEITPVGIFNWFPHSKFKKKDMHETVVTRVSSDVIAITPSSDLKPGEYLLTVLAPGRHGAEGGHGYDFTVLP